MIAGAITLVLLFGILPLFLPRVDELPFGLDPIMSTFMDSINTILAVLPMMETIWHVFIIAITVKMSLYIYNTMWRLVELIRG